MKSLSQKPAWRILLPVTLLLVLAACASLANTYPIQVSTETEQKAIFVRDFQFGEYRIPVGGLGGSVGENTGRGRKSAGILNIKVPKTATFRWKKRVHYSKYKDLPLHEYTVQLPQEMPKLRSDQTLLFLFLIKEDNTVTVEVRPR